MTLFHPQFGRYYLNHKGYPVISGGSRRKQYLHRAVWEFVAGLTVPPGWHVHHMDGCKSNWHASNLVALPACLHQASETLRCPITGCFMSADAYVRRYGALPAWRISHEVPF